MFASCAPLRSGTKSYVLAATGLVLIAWAWWPGALAPYQYDDFVTPLADPASQSLAHFVHALPHTLRPLTKLTYALESSLGLSSAPQRRVLNALLFVLSVGLIVRLAREAGLKPGYALCLATLWALHPVHAETILALAGRSVLLALCLTLGSAYALVRRQFPYAIGFAVAAVLARETALLWLLACATWCASLLGFSRRQLWASSGAASLVGGTLVLASERMRALLEFSWEDPSALERLGLQWAALPRGLWLFVRAPSAFSVDMEFAPAGASRALYIIAATAIYGLALWAALRKANALPLRVFATLWLCWVIPLHSVVPKLDALTARSVSAGSAGLSLAIAAVWSTRPPRTGYRCAGFAAGFAVAMGLLVPLTRERAALYRDPVALWRDAAEQSTHSLRPLLNLGTLLAQRGRLREAEAALFEATQRSPNSMEAGAKLAAVRTLMRTEHLLRAPRERPGAGAHPPPKH